MSYLVVLLCQRALSPCLKIFLPNSTFYSLFCDLFCSFQILTIVSDFIGWAFSKPLLRTSQPFFSTFSKIFSIFWIIGRFLRPSRIWPYRRFRLDAAFQLQTRRATSSLFLLLPFIKSNEEKDFFFGLSKITDVISSGASNFFPEWTEYDIE